MTTQTDNLQSKLQEKEELVAALTERLEQAASQLDRFQRSGKQPGFAPTGISTEMLEEHSDVLGQMREAIERWDEMQSDVTLGRIEIQLTELRDLIVNRVPADLHLSQPTTEPSHGGTLPGVDNEEDAEQIGWESLKAQLLGDEVQPPSDSEDLPGLVADVEEAIKEMEPPSTIGEEIDDPVVLRTGLIERDEYIAQLLQQLRRIETQVFQPPDWEQLEQVPEDLKTELEQLHDKLEDRLRRAEVELSLERARIGREEALLNHQRHVLQKELTQRGLTFNDDGELVDLDPSGKTDEENEQGRWFRFLGGQKEDA